MYFIGLIIFSRDSDYGIIISQTYAFFQDHMAFWNIYFYLIMKLILFDTKNECFTLTPIDILLFGIFIFI